MTRLTYEQILIGNLQQKFPVEMKRVYATREQAYEELKRYTSQDFGYDVAAWKTWFKENKRPAKRKKDE